MIDSSDILNARILIVDDQAANVRDLKRMLAAAGYTSIAATMDSRTVCKLHRRNRYDIVLLDLQMPDLDGFQIMQGLLEPEVDDFLPILLIAPKPSDKMRALQAGAKDFISKPFDQAEVLMRVHNMLEVRMLHVAAKNYGEFLEQMVDERTATLRDSEELFRQAVEACPSGMVMTDHDGKMVMVNTETERLFGYRRDELLGQPIEILVPSGLRHRHAQHRANFACRPEERRVGGSRELSGLRKDGTEFPVEIGINPIQTGEELLVLSVVVDISERKRIERLKDEFVSTVSHELRTPLTSISGSLGLLVGGGAGKLPETAERLLTIAQANSQRLVRLLNDILDIEKIESGKLAFDLEKIAIRPLIAQAIESIRGFAEGYGVRVRLEAGSDSADVRADSYRLLQVITNLLSNAIKFSPRGQKVTVAIQGDPDTVRISVRDYGPGIPQDFKPRVFEKFAQADTSDARHKGGTGLGLSIVREIVTRMGGQVDFEDAPGGGTIFRVTLPGWKREAAREAGLATEAHGAPLALRKAQLRRSGSRAARGAKAAI